MNSLGYYDSDDCRAVPGCLILVLDIKYWLGVTEFPSRLICSIWVFTVETQALWLHAVH